MNISKIAISVLAGGLLAGGAAAQAPSTVVPKAADEVGISSRDGITMSANDVIVTRNGVSEKLTKELELTNGTRVRPDGVIITRDAGKVALRPEQLLTFDGRFLNIPVRESAPQSTSTTTIETKPAEKTVTKETKEVTEKPATKEAAEEAAQKEADRRARSAAEK